MTLFEKLSLWSDWEKIKDKAMNKDEVISLVTHLVTLGLGSAASAGYVSGSDATTIGGAIGALAGVGYGVYLHWNMKKVPEHAIVR